MQRSHTVLLTDKDLVDKPTKPADWKYLRQCAPSWCSIAESHLVAPAK